MQKKHHFYDVCTGVSINNLDDDEKLQEVSSSSELMDTFYIRNNFFSVFHYIQKLQRVNPFSRT